MIAPRRVAPRSLPSHLGALKAHLSAWIETCADYYQAATLYERLARLSDAELRRRGLSRATLGQDIAQACDRTSRRVGSITL